MPRCLMLPAVCCSLLFGVCGLSWGQGPQDADLLSFTSVPTKERLLVGEPLFLRLSLRSIGDQSLQIDNLAEGEGISGLVGGFEVACEGEVFRVVPLRQIAHRTVRTAPAAVLNAGQAVTGCFTVWFSAYGDIPEERALVFRRGGDYRYRITLLLVLVSGPEKETRALTSEGSANWSGRPRGFSEMVRGLREILSDDSVVRYTHVAVLDSLLTELDGSPYAKYAKWQRIRSYLVTGIGRDGKTLRTGRDNEQAERLSALSDDLLFSVKNEAPPVLRDALSMKGICLLIGGREAEARAVCEELEKAFPPSHGMRELRRRLDSIMRKRSRGRGK